MPSDFSSLSDISHISVEIYVLTFRETPFCTLNIQYFFILDLMVNTLHGYCSKQDPIIAKEHF